ncbi:MAG: sensor domain-containing diguanylate cyclase [Desulfarculus sp.]|nr:sensor domain-containing diguanylate cyclase [Desulfarculus sp.]
MARIAAALLALLLGLGLARAADPGPPAPLAPLRLAVLEDPQANLDFVTIPVRSQQGAFTPLPGTDLSLGSRRSPCWVRLDLPAPKPDSGQAWFLELEKGIIDQVDLYLPLIQPPGEWLQVAAGILRPRPPEQEDFRSQVFRLPADLDWGRPCYLRLACRMPLSMNLRLWSDDGLLAMVYRDSLAFGLIYGVMGAMLLFNLAMYLSLRDRVYLNYLALVGSMLLAQVVMQGHLRSLLTMPSPTLPQLQSFTMGCSLFFAALFTRGFLLTPVNAPFWDKLLNVFMVMALGVLFLSAMNRADLALGLGYVAATLGPIHGLIAGWVCLRRGFRPAGWFMLAWLALLLGVLGFLLGHLGLAPKLTLVLPASRTLAAVLLAFALTLRVRELHQEREQLAQSQRRYREMSMTDGLTGLYNRRYFESRLASELDHARRLDNPLSLIMLDLDDFKAFNDRHGHLAGDQVLKALAAVLRLSLREGDCACRYGGEEFAVILPASDLEGARLVAERVRAGMERGLFRETPGLAAEVTLSLGVARLRDDEDAHGLVARADLALYRAKAAGKNRVEMAD